MPDSLNDIAANIVKRVAGEGFVQAAPNECLCNKFAHLIAEQDRELKKLRETIDHINSNNDHLCLEDDL